MKKSLFPVVALLGAVVWSSCQKANQAEELRMQPLNGSKSALYRPATASSSPLISNVYEYLPAGGQFVNSSGIGTLAAAQALVGSTSNMVSLGAFGGYIIFGFDHSVSNGTGADLGVYGNPIGGSYQWSEPGVVMVSQDVNNNGIPDDPWYELAGSEYNSSATVKNYRITYYNPHAVGTSVAWKDNQGNSGVVQANAYHTTNNYYPTFAANQDSISFTGTKLANTLAAGSIVSNLAFAWGYSDSYSSDYSTYGYNTFDISWAVDSSGNPVTLGYIDFVKVYTGQNCNGGAMGEISTEVKGARDLHI
ncbi:hypothetical protein CLV59_103552 [Chitinophaga dinghuensis]|uniref:PKD domain-containing protein n=1 Tax=Chitinophaga dinghuensis TaxID=1539050 RepID=A0A327W4I3_9BACT|nr:PKD domain-containing protein [Chitinophaga dinghuensis]RAJ83583.1 hypothetical protein CLV59_103552 [Chitinophaga dinghuensis]